MKKGIEKLGLTEGGADAGAGKAAPEITKLSLVAPDVAEGAEVRALDAQKEGAAADTGRDLKATAEGSIMASFMEALQEADKDTRDSVWDEFKELFEGKSDAKDERKKGKKVEKKDKKEKPEHEKKLFGIGLLTLRSLRKKYKDQGEFAKMLEELRKVSEINPQIAGHPLLRLFDRISILQVFKKSPKQMKGILSMFGLSDKDYKALFLLEKKRHGTELTGEQEEAVKDVLRKHIFQNSSGTEIERIYLLIEDVVSTGRYLTPNDIAELAFLVDENDYKRMIGLLVGQQRYSALENAA